MESDAKLTKSTSQSILLLQTGLISIVEWGRTRKRISQQLVEHLVNKLFTHCFSINGIFVKIPWRCGLCNDFKWRQTYTPTQPATHTTVHLIVCEMTLNLTKLLCPNILLKVVSQCDLYSERTKTEPHEILWIRKPIDLDYLRINAKIRTLQWLAILNRPRKTVGSFSSSKLMR